MAIYCMQCGKELPDGAKFCLKCGNPVGSAVKPTPQPEQKWEYCEIVCKVGGFSGLKSYFMAQATGSHGVYIAARSTKTFYGIDDTGGDYPDTQAWGGEKKAKAALDEMISLLSADGWALTGDKGSWCQYKYRRRERS